MNRHLTALFVATLVGCGGTSTATQPPAAPAVAAPSSVELLDGRSFVVTLDVPDSPPVKDTLRFEGGKFESTACTALGFPQWSNYAAFSSQGGVGFHVLAKHPSGTTMNWNGNILGDSVQGSANRTMKGKTDVITFKGSLRP